MERKRMACEVKSVGGIKRASGRINTSPRVLSASDRVQVLCEELDQLARQCDGELAADEDTECLERIERVQHFAVSVEDPFSRNAQAAHVTAQAFVWHEGKLLLHRHKRWPLWLGPGGHVDAGELPSDAAIRETVEETGVLATIPITATDPIPIDVDIHEIPDGHIHYDIRYLFVAHSPVLVPAEGESAEVGWYVAPRAIELGDESLARSIRRCLSWWESCGADAPNA